MLKVNPDLIVDQQERIILKFGLIKRVFLYFIDLNIKISYVTWFFLLQCNVKSVRSASEIKSLEVPKLMAKFNNLIYSFLQRRSSSLLATLAHQRGHFCNFGTVT